MAVAGMGNRDTTSAIVGGIVALSAGEVPADWAACREPLPTSVLISEIDHPQHSRGVYRAAALKDEANLQTNADAGSPVSIRVDPLTGLPNLLGLLDAIDRLIEKPEGLPFSLVSVQLVPLWDVNRSAGRTAGDNLIRDCSTALHNLGFGPVFRTGGDKFVVLIQDPSLAVEQAGQIAQVVTRPGYRLPRTARILFPFKEEAVGGRLMDGPTLQDLLHSAEKGLKAAKEAGKNRVVVN